MQTSYSCASLRTRADLGCHLSHDTVKAIRDTLRTLLKLKGDDYKPPTVVQLRSASLNPSLARQVPRFVHRTVSFCLHYSHVDMKRACTVYQHAAHEGLLDYIFVDPPTIHDPQGRECTGYKLISTEKQDTALSYADLGASMCELAERRAVFLQSSCRRYRHRHREKQLGRSGRLFARWCKE